MISQIVINCERAAPQFNGDKELTVNAFSFDTSIFGAGITSSITHNPLKPDENYSGFKWRMGVRRYAFPSGSQKTRGINITKYFANLLNKI